MIDDLKSKIGKIIESKDILGLAVEEKCLLAADMHYDGESIHVKSGKILVFPEGISFEKPLELGELLRQFLKDNGFTAKKAIIGIPAKWLMMREKIVPPSTRESVAGMLRIQAEREFSIGAQELVIDYTGDVNQEKSSRLILGAVRRRNYEKVLEAVQTAGLSVLSVTLSSMALRTIIQNHIYPTIPDYFLYARRDFVEILIGENKQVIGVKHIQRDDSSDITHLISEIKRVISLHPRLSREMKKAVLIVWDPSGIDDYQLQDIRDSFPQVDILNSDVRAITKEIGFSLGNDYNDLIIPATLGNVYVQRDSFYLDFYHSRMNLKNGTVNKKHITWASALILALIIFVLNMFIAWKSDKNDVMELKLRLEEMKEDTRAAQNIIQKVTLARSWYSERPEILRCLRELTLAFPVEGRVWATNLALNEEMKGIISGKAVDEKSVIEVLDTLRDKNLFSDTQMIHIRENGQTSQEVSFSMSFSFRGRG